jgi:hypothetical protein
MHPPCGGFYMYGFSWEGNPPHLKLIGVARERPLQTIDRLASRRLKTSGKLDTLLLFRVVSRARVHNRHKWHRR